MRLSKISEIVQKGKYFLTQHAIERMVERSILLSEAVEAIGNGEIIEQYPDDKYGPSCLIYGRTQNNRPLHILVSESEPLWIITAYDPAPEEWIDFKVRRKPQ